MTYEVTLKTSKSESHWIYVLQSYESGNSTEHVICFDDNEKLRGFVIVGQWEFDAFFKLAAVVLDRLKQLPEGQKSLSVSIHGNPLSPMSFKAQKEWNSEKWKVVLSCPQPAQCWKTWNSGSGSPRNFVLYLSLPQMVSLFDRLVDIPEMGADSAGFVDRQDSWVESSSVDRLGALPAKILLGARGGILDPQVRYCWPH